jgi:hypothetical protein
MFGGTVFMVRGRTFYPSGMMGHVPLQTVSGGTELVTVRASIFYTRLITVFLVNDTIHFSFKFLCAFTACIGLPFMCTSLMT